MAIKKTCLALVVLLGGCQGDIGGSDELVDARAAEIVDNLLAAGYPDSEIEVRDDGEVIVGQDAVVSLEASREMAGRRHVESAFYTDDEDQFRQYRTNNLVSSSVDVICIDGSAYTGTMSTALNEAIDNYNDQNLSFSMVRTNGSNSGCDAEITARKTGGTGGYAGFPSGGQPYHEINIGTSNPNYGLALTTHVITHELGHCIGFRHSDYYNRAISCGSGGSEGSSGIGANHIPGTPQTASYNGSVMNSCVNLGSDGVWTSSDVIALQTLYSGGGGGGGGGGEPEPSPSSCYGACGSNAGQCWCDSLCEQYGDCCSDKADYCG